MEKSYVIYFSHTHCSSISCDLTYHEDNPFFSFSPSSSYVFASPLEAFEYSIYPRIGGEVTTERQ